MSEFLNFQDVPVVALDELVQSGDIELGRGNIISKIDIRAVSGLYPIYSSSSKNNGMMGRYGKFMFDEEMVTWSVDGGGTFFYRPRHKFSVTNVSGYMRANQKKFDYKFLHGVLDYQHSFLNFDYQSKAHPSVIRELYEIPIPPLPEQKKIASILTSVDEVIENTQKQIDKLQDLKKATMNDLLTKGIGPGGGPHTEFKDSELGRIPKSWEIQRISELSSLVTNGFVGSASSHYRETGIPYLVSKNIRDNFIDERGLTYISREFHEKTSKSKLVQGDLLTVQSGHVGSSAVVTGEYDGANCHALILTRFNITSVDSNFMAYYLNSTLGRLRLSIHFVGSTIVHLNTSDLKKFAVPVPSLKEQENIVSTVDSIQNQIDDQFSKLHKTQSLKKSLMQDLLTGKVRVTVN